MAGTLRFLNYAAGRVFVIRFIGEISGRDALARIRDHLETDPPAATYAVIMDVRAWAGMIADDEIIEHFGWMSGFRERHGLSMARPAMTYLTPHRIGADAVASQMSALRGRNIKVAHSPEDAWAAIVTGEPIPPEVRAFLQR